MSDKLDPLLSELLISVGNRDFLKFCHTVRKILNSYTIGEVLENLSPLSRQQTELVLWVQDYFKIIKERNE